MNLGRYFTHRGIQVSGFFGNNPGTAKEAAQFTNSKFYNNIQQLIKDSEVIFITTPDDTIPNIDQQISRFDLKNKSICHTSGSLKSFALSNAKKSGAFIYSIHPIFAFSSKNINFHELEKIYFSIEGDISNEASNMPVLTILKILGNKYFVRKSEDSASYHLANVFVSNLVLSLLEIGAEYFAQIGLSQEEALEAMAPLVKGNIENIFEKGFVDSLTGPIARGDVQTVKRHLEALQAEDRILYKKLSLNLLKLTAQKRQPFEKKIDALNHLVGESENYRKLLEILEGE